MLIAALVDEGLGNSAYLVDRGEAARWNLHWLDDPGPQSWATAHGASLETDA